MGKLLIPFLMQVGKNEQQTTQISELSVAD